MTIKQLVSLEFSLDYLAASSGFLRTIMTESPRRNIFEMNRSRFTGWPPIYNHVYMVY